MTKTVRITRDTALARAAKNLLGVEGRELAAAHIQASAQVALAWVAIASNLKRGETIVCEPSTTYITQSMD